MKRFLICILLAMIIFTGCDSLGLFQEDDPPDTGLLKFTFPLVQAYELDRLWLVCVNTETDQASVFGLDENENNTEAVLEVQLENGSYEAYVVQEKAWDDINGCSLYCETDRFPFNIDAEEFDLEIENPWLTGTVDVSFNIDFTAMIDGGVTPEHAGVWLVPDPEGDLSGVFNYHFHAEPSTGNIYSGSFALQPGDYIVDVLGTNFDHPDWTDNEPWHEDLTGKVKEYAVTIVTGTTDVSLTAGIGFSQNFDNSSAPVFTENANGGTIDYVANGDGMALHMAGNGEDNVPKMDCDPVVEFDDNQVITLDFRLGTYNEVLNGTHPYLHINLLEEGDSRVFVTIGDDGIDIQSNAAGNSVSSDGYSFGTDYFNDGVYHTLSFFLKNRYIYVYEDLTGDPVFAYRIDNQVPYEGGLSLECHQEIYIDNFVAEIEITGDLSIDVTVP